MLVDAFEDPRTTGLLRNAACELGIEFLSNQHSALYALIGRATGTQVAYTGLNAVY